MNFCSNCGMSAYMDSFVDQNRCMCSAGKGTSKEDLVGSLSELHVQENDNVPRNGTTPSISEDTIHTDFEASSQQTDTLSTLVQKSKINPNGKMLLWPSSSDDDEGADAEPNEEEADAEQEEEEDADADLLDKICAEYSNTSMAQKCSCKSQLSPLGKMPSWSASSDEEEEADAELLDRSCPVCSKSYERSISIPLVSAFKGSREKQGESKKLSVTWAPDVYDPTPRSLSPVRKVIQRSKNNKKNGKNKQKGKAAPRVSTGKDKKQLRRISGNSNSCFKTLDSRDRLVYDDDNDYDMDYDVGSPDSYCGKSYMKKSHAGYR